MGYQWTCSMLTSLVLNRPFTGTSFWAVLGCWGILSLQPSRHLTPKTNFGWFNARLVVVYWYLHVTISRDLYNLLLFLMEIPKNQQPISARLGGLTLFSQPVTVWGSAYPRYPATLRDVWKETLRPDISWDFEWLWEIRLGIFWALGDTRYTVHSLRKSYIYIHTHISILPHQLLLVLSGSLPAQLVVYQPLGVGGEAPQILGTKGSINPGALSCSRGGVILDLLPDCVCKVPSSGHGRVSCQLLCVTWL